MNELLRRSSPRWVVLALIAIVAASAITHFSERLPYEERLIQAGLKDSLGRDARSLFSETPELQALMLDYTAAPELLFKARLALTKCGDDARAVLMRYGAESDFQRILADYGEGIVPVIGYFLANDPASLRAVKRGQHGLQNLAHHAQALLNDVGGKTGDSNAAETSPEEWGPQARGWYAVQSIRTRGHDFLGEFVIGTDGKARWIQSERVVKAIADFFTSGVVNLERKYALDQAIGAADLFWAGVDTAIVFSTVKALRALRGVPGGRAMETAAGASDVSRAGEVGTSLRGGAIATRGEATLFERTRLIGARLLPNGALGRAVVKAGAAGLLVYVVVRHPGVLNSIFDEVATALGFNPFIVKVAAWTLLIGSALAVVMPLIRISLRSLIVALVFLVRALQFSRPFLERGRTVSIASQPTK